MVNRGALSGLGLQPADPAQGLPVAPGYAELVGSWSASAGLPYPIIGPIDVRGWSSASLHVVGGSGSNNFAVEASNDGVNWVGLTVAREGGGYSILMTTGTNLVPGAFIYLIPLIGRYLRVNATQWSSGTSVATLELSTAPAPNTRGAETYSGAGGSATSVSVANPATPSLDAQSLPTGPMQTMQWMWNGLTWDRKQAPRFLTTAAVSAAGVTTVVAAPGAGKLLRLMRLLVTLTGNASIAGGGVVTLTLDYAANAAPIFDVYVPAVAPNVAGLNWSSGWLDLGNGVPAITANTALTAYLPAALATGNFRVHAVTSY